MEVRVLNVEDNPEWEKEFGTEIPVIFIEGKKAFKYRVDETQLERKLKDLWNR